jgi:hypothetical protein
MYNFHFGEENTRETCEKQNSVNQQVICFVRCRAGPTFAGKLFFFKSEESEKF